MRHRLLLVSLCLIIIKVTTIPVMAFGEGCSVLRATPQSIGSSAAWTAISFPTEIRDDVGFHNASSAYICVPSGFAGWYSISGSLQWMYGFTGGSLRSVVLLLNDANILGWSSIPPSYWARELSSSAEYYLGVGDCVSLGFYQDSGSSLDVVFARLGLVRMSGEEICDYPVECSGPMDAGRILISEGNQEEGYSWDYRPWVHGSEHEFDGDDEINVAGLSGILTDTQDAGWFQGLAITTTDVADGQILAWNVAAEEWQPATISGTGSFTMPDIITATISGTVPVIISNTYQFTEALSSGHDMAIIRSFTYGEASIAIGLFAVAAILGIHLLFVLQK